MKKVILHIGSPKCATSSIQAMLHKNRDVLKKNAIYYPTLGIPVKVHGHHNLSYEYSISKTMTDKFKSEYGGWNELLADLQKQEFDTAIISTEALFRKQQHIVNKIAGLLSDFDVTVACWLRRQDQFMESAYNQLEKFSAPTIPFEEFIAEKYSLADFHKILLPWSRAFDQLKVASLDDMDRSRPAVSNFLSWLNLVVPEDLAIEDIGSNSRVGKNTLKALAYVERQLALKNIPLTTLNRGKIIDHCQNFDNSKVDYFVTEGSRAKFLQTYQESNSNLAKLIGLQADIFKAPTIALKTSSEESEYNPEDDEFITSFIKRLIDYKKRESRRSFFKKKKQTPKSS